MDLHSVICFLGASILLTLAPGPDNIFVVTQGVSRGRKAAVITALGMCSGLSVHTTAAALGISAVFYSSALAFCAVKYAGAAYLMYLAWKAIQDRNALKLNSPGSQLSCFALFRRGFIMNTLNPKVALFFLAFLPQFVSVNSQHVVMEMIFLGLIFMVQSVVIFTAIGVLSGQVGKYVLKNPGIARKFSLATAGIFAAIGVRLALAER
jgi:threonine/homoserine/homoserine lactone efflux protein